MSYRAEKICSIFYLIIIFFSEIIDFFPSKVKHYYSEPHDLETKYNLSHRRIQLKIQSFEKIFKLEPNCFAVVFFKQSNEVVDD